MFTKKQKSPLKMLALTALILPSIAWSGESCNALLNLGLYNVSQSSSAADGQSLSLSTFCSADYSSSSTTSERKAAIKGSYGLFSAGASGSVSDSEIIVKQANLCTSGFDSSSYSNQASAYSQTVYQGTLDAWNKCQVLSQKGLDFEVRASSTLQGVTVIITPASGVSANFKGLYQDGVGLSVCKRTLAPPVGSTIGKVVTVDQTSAFKFNAAQKLTINCKRNMQKDLQGNLSADAQDLIFVTSADTLRVPMAAIGSLARATVDKVKAEIQDAVAKDTQTYLTNTTNVLTTQINNVSNTVSNNQTTIDNKIDTLATKLAKWTSIPQTYLGVLPMSSIGTVTYNLPNSIPADAKEVLVYVYLTTGDTPDGSFELKIFTDENSVEYAQYLYANGYHQNAVSYNSDNLWLPITSARTIKVTSSGTPKGSKVGSGIFVLGYR